MIYIAVWMILINVILNNSNKIQTKKVHTRWFHLHQVQEEAKLLNDNRTLNMFTSCEERYGLGMDIGEPSRVLEMGTLS